MDESRADVVVLCALPVEFHAVRRHLVKLREVTHPAGTVYEVGVLPAGKRPRIALVEVGQGNPAAASACERAIAYFQPSVALFVGVAGGLKDVAIGDVVAGDRVAAYESGKDGRSYLPRITSHHAASPLVEQARAVARSPRWRRRIANRSTSPSVFVGPIAAGEKVLASERSGLRTFLAQHCSDALAVEMEGYGFLHAAWTNRAVAALVVRGISDLLLKTPVADRALQPTAADHAAAFAVELLSRLDLPSAEDSEATPGSLSLSDMRERLDRIRHPVATLFGGIGPCGEVSYQGKDWDVVSVDVGGEELDLFFDELLDHSSGREVIDDRHRQDIDDHIRSLPVQGRCS